MAKKPRSTSNEPILVYSADNYHELISGIGSLLEEARRTSARAVNAVLTGAYWEIGRRIVEHEQGGEKRAGYGEALLIRLSADLSRTHGRGFSKSNLFQMRAFYLGWEIFQTPSGKLTARARQTEGLPSSELPARSPDQPPLLGESLLGLFPLSWSHYVRLMTVESDQARTFYEAEAIRGAWSVRQLDRQIATQFYERVAASRRKDAMLANGQTPKPEDVVTVQEEIRSPYVLEFLGLKDEYSESDLEEALIRHLEAFLLELGKGFTFVARQKRIPIDDVWYRMDLVLFHRRLRALVIVDIKLGRFTHADAGQMNLYLNYARENLAEPGEGEPIGIILCSEKSDTVVRYATGGMNAQVFASRYLTSLPDEEELRREIEKTRLALNSPDRPNSA
ncbi:PDDEXK nuclease domain-containing protein [Aquisphaera insulae]|uniref:PDDEXK nuclease domain-containing protein n=1 Tax=Aquisphaera insulae TaxID=2712864 RepID=UPI0013EE015A|nr:PDDEXK nuclease domain-containing protein [Aquisphaera insulae]